MLITHRFTLRHIDFAIDDDLMKEFAAAVQGQKDVSAAKKADAEAGKLINEFENFVTKKS